MNDSWRSGNPYEKFMGRWSLLVAKEFFSWLAVAPASSWLDIGCGTGILTRCILETQHCKDVTAIDSSKEFIAYAQQTVKDPSVNFKVGLAQSLALESNSIDATVSGLMLNFIPQPETAVLEMLRVTKSGGTIGIFLWDYGQGMEMLRYFWDTAVKLDKNAQKFDEGLRFPLCQEGQLESLVREVGLQHVEATRIEVRTEFPNFDDYWQPFLGHVGPAPAYTMSLPAKDRQMLEETLRQSLPTHSDGSITLTARAWAVKGTA